MREICMSGSMNGVWRRSHGRTSEAPPNERGGNGYVQPTATAPHLDSTELSRSVGRRWTTGLGGFLPFAATRLGDKVASKADTASRGAAGSGWRKPDFPSARRPSLGMLEGRIRR